LPTPSCLSAVSSAWARAIIRCPGGVLSYDTRQGGFVIDLDRRRLEKAPSYMASNLPNWSDRTYGSRIDEFYGVPSYWTMI
jgi:hypothetical protein